MAITELPSKDSHHLFLVVGASEELLAQQKANSEEWRGALSLEAYLRREDTLAAQDLTKDGGLTGWMLVYQPDPKGPRHVLCGCETIVKKALVSQDGQVSDVTCHGVASVFCPPPHRGNGYAGRLMAELGKKLKTWNPTNQQAETLFSVLYSDIGKDFYAARGWYPFPSTHIELPAAKSRKPDSVRLLESTDLEELCSIDEKLIRHRLGQFAGTGQSAVALVPDYRTVQWHHAREEFVSNELFGIKPSVKGAMVDHGLGSRVWAYWTRVWTNPQEEAPNTLHILRLVIENESFSDFSPASVEKATKLKETAIASAIVDIFSVAQAEAAEWDMQVQIWNPSSVTLAAAQSILPDSAVVHREKESVTSLQWYGDGSWKGVDWVCNEKYGWC